MAATAIDLFAGCGGLSLGLAASGFRHLFAVEAHRDAFRTYRKNLIDRSSSTCSWPDWLEVGHHDLLDIIASKRGHVEALRGSVDLVSGGPPCQGFSTNGRRNPNDPRSRMVEAYIEFVGMVQPRLVLIENVQGFATMRHSTGLNYADYTRSRLGELGYDCWAEVLPAASWGVPQRRPRFILIAAPHGSLPGINPIQRLKVNRRAFLASRGLGPGPTAVRDALSDLETAGRQRRADPEYGSSGFEVVDYTAPTEATPYLGLMRRGAAGVPSDMRLARHSTRAIERMKAMHATCRPGICLSPLERESVGLKKRTTTVLRSDLPSPTVTTLPDDLVHYSEPRTMTVREHARLQSFSDWFSFEWPYTSGGAQRKVACPRYTQVANAVPPLFAEALGETLLGLLASQQVSQSLDILKMADEVAA